MTTMFEPAQTEEYAALWNRALWYLGRRDYGVQELRLRLLRPRPNKPPAGEDDVETALARLQELGYLNDERRAQRLAETLRQKGWGLRKIQMELGARGLPAVQEDSGMEELPKDGDVLARLLETKYAAKLGEQRGRRAVYQALLRRGFQHADIRQAMRDYADGLEETGMDEYCE
jgi:regulatory protein